MSESAIFCSRLLCESCKQSTSYSKQQLLQSIHFVTLLMCEGVHSTLPYPALPNPVTSLYRAPFWRRCHGKHGAHVHRNAYVWSRARGRMYTHNVHVCMYACTCMRFTLHSELRAYPSYGHPPRRRCLDKGWLSVLC